MIKAMIMFLMPCALTCGMVWGFGPYEHRVAAPSSARAQANLADYWGQSFAIHWEDSYAEIVPLFPWTHGCVRRGRINGVPRTPTIYGQNADGHAPEQDMLVLISKMTAAHQSAPLLAETARGFKTHNKLDSCAHFTLFPGGTLTNWGRHHFCEQYAQFPVFEIETGIFLEGTMGTIYETVNSQGHAGIILLAQKAFRKARHSIDSLDPTLVPEQEREAGPVGTLTDINTAITWSKTLGFSGAGKTAARTEAVAALGGEAAFVAWEAGLEAAWPNCKAGAQQ